MNGNRFDNFMTFIAGFFKETTNESAIRLIAIFATINLFGILWYQNIMKARMVLQGKEYSIDWLEISSFFALTVLGKLGQKYQERKTSTNPLGLGVVKTIDEQIKG